MSMVKRGKRIARRLLIGSGRRHQELATSRRIANMAQLPTVRVAVAGAGRYAVRHLDVLSAMGNVRLVGIANRGGSDLSDLARRYGIAATFGDFRKMLDTTRPDAVFVVVSHFETVRVAAECLERGLPCLIEKPAGFTSADTARLAELAARNGCRNMVGVNRRYLSTLHYGLARVLQRGPLMGIGVECPEAIRKLRAQGDHDPRLYELWLAGNSIHTIDLFRCLGGEVVDFAGRRDCREERTGDSFAAIMRLSKGGIGTFTAHWLSAQGWTLTLYGRGLKVVLNLDKQAEVVTDSGQRSAVPVDPIDQRFKPGLFAQDQAFITALAQGESLAYPASDLADSTRTMQLIEAIANA